MSQKWNSESEDSLGGIAKEAKIDSIGMAIEKKPENVDHENWSNPIQMILTSIGLAVGLGNVWRFPYLAYANGGMAFLIPYIFFGLTFGLPVMYAEFLLGQYSRGNPAVAFYRYAPAFAGVGTFTAILSFLITCFYAVVCSWALLYLGFVIGGQSYKWTNCDNFWNTAACISSDAHRLCRDKNVTMPFSDGKGGCLLSALNGTANGATEFFSRMVEVHSPSITKMGSVNWYVGGCVVIMYIFCAMTLWKGTKILEKTNYVTVPLPYIVVLIFFFRVFFLDGSWDGIKVYIFQPDITKLGDLKTWKAALTQITFSLTLGCGALISMASHNKANNNCFRDALFVVGFDSLMSLLGGVAVFGTLGYLAKMGGKQLKDVVSGGPSLVFISYPEASSTMPINWLWNLLFFAMIFFLGFSSMVGMLSFITDFLITTSGLKTKLWKALIPSLLCFLLMIIGILLSTDIGSWWFDIMADFVGTTAPCLAVFFEIALIAWVYRWKNMKADMVEMWGEPPKKRIVRWTTRFSPIFGWSWMILAPLFALICIAVTLNRDHIPTIIEGTSLPLWAELTGWLMNLCPLIPVVIVFFINWQRYHRRGIPFKYLFMPTRDLPSHDRFYKIKGIPPPDGWARRSST